MTAIQTPMDLFIGLSSVLTGIAAIKLAPALDPDDIKQVFFDTAQGHDSATFNALLKVYAGCQAEPPATIAATVFEQPDLRFMARAIMLSWYLGAWYKPSDLQLYSGPKAPKGPPLPSTVISAGAYTQGWAWNVAQAHPMGYSNFTFGYWAGNPPTLADFTQGEPA